MRSMRGQRPQSSKGEHQVQRRRGSSAYSSGGCDFGWEWPRMRSVWVQGYNGPLFCLLTLCIISIDCFFVEKWQKIKVQSNKCHQINYNLTSGKLSKSKVKSGKKLNPPKSTAFQRMCQRDRIKLGSSCISGSRKNNLRSPASKRWMNLDVLIQ